ncbi:MAG TPA: NAD(P)/FAD-dependent oxidoreductase [Ilumatobacter sp.]|nr:NAD(P)/FAD-dependent oxidoreductase [Ilumatobacter sp.]
MPDPSDQSGDQFDVIVIGAGSTGTNVAGYARQHGLTVAVIESEWVGGDCSYWACMPSKALLGPVHALATARRFPGSDAAEAGHLDTRAVFDRRDDIVSHFDDSGQADWLESIGAALIRGHGRLVGERRVSVAANDGPVRYLTANRAVVVATGSRPTMPEIAGLADANPWTSRHATSASAVPPHLAILGGGVVGCEMAQAYRGLGAEVTIVERSGRLLNKYEPWVGALLGEAFTSGGIDVITDAAAQRVVRELDGTLTITIALTGSDGETRTFAADEVLVAAGRTANTDDLGLDTIGITHDYLGRAGFLEVDDRLAATGVDGDWLFAAGDVNGRALLTHQGKYQARVVGDVLGGVDITAWADHVAVPQVVFTHPEIASVGRTSVNGKPGDGVGDDDDSHLKFVTVPLGSVAAATLANDTSGKASITIDTTRNVIVGATFVGPGAGELLHSATVAIIGEVTIDKLWHAVPSYPTVSELWLRLLEANREQ